MSDAIPQPKPEPATERQLDYYHSLMIKRNSDKFLNSLPPDWRAVAVDVMDAMSNYTVEYVYEQKCFAKSDLKKFITEILKPEYGPYAPYATEICGPAGDPRTDNMLAIQQWQEASKVTTPTPDIFKGLKGNHPLAYNNQGLEDGIYQKPDGTIYRVYYNLAKTHLLAKKLVLVKSGELTASGANDGPIKVKVKWVYAGAASRFVSPAEKMPYEQAKAFGALYGMCIYGHPLNDPVSIHLGIGPVCGERQFGEEFTFMVEQAKLELGKK